VLRARDRRDSRRVARGSAEQGGPADVDHLDRLVDPDQPSADLRGEGLDVDDDDVDEADAVGAELLDLLGDVTPGEDSRIHRGVERLDLAADEGGDLGELRNGGDLDPVRGQVLASPVGGEDLDAEGEQVAGEGGDAVPIRHREQGSQPGSPSRNPWSGVDPAGLTVPARDWTRRRSRAGRV
jgi:hypothetical protein